MDAERAEAFISAAIDSSALPTLMEYVRIPSVSPSYDSDWATNGHMQRAMEVLLDWVDAQGVVGLTRELITHPKCPPVLYMEVKGTDPSLPTALIYGHMDKQPPFTGWSDFCGPYSPAIKDGVMYGRGCVDDGYSITSAVLAVKAIQEQGLPHGRFVIVIENEEESESENLLSNLDTIKRMVGEANFIVCLDSGTLDFKRLWLTASLRGFLDAVVKVRVLDNGVHSGDASGIVPSSFRVMRQILDRLEDSRTGESLLPQLYAPITPEARERAQKLAQFAGSYLYTRFPFVTGAGPTTLDPVELVLNALVRPTLCVTGAEGLPEAATAGNVLRPETTLRLSFRTPAGVDEEAALKEALRVITENPPYNSQITIEFSCSGKGWAMRPPSPWFSSVCSSASDSIFHNAPMHLGEGGSIPLMRSLQDMYPSADFLVTGVLGPESNAHGPDENMNIEYWKKFTACLALILQGHSRS